MKSLQNMAPNAQRSIVISLAISAIAVVIYMFAVQPCSISLDEAKRTLQQLQDQ